MKKATVVTEKIFQSITYVAALCTIIFLFSIIGSVFKEGLPFFHVVSLKQVFTSTQWFPTANNPEFGILALIVGSFSVTIVALIIAVPLGLGSAIYLSEVAKPSVRELVKPIIELLAGIPSVVYGLFGMAFLAPLFRQCFHLETGLTLFTASVILGIMVIPIISSMSEDALSAVPKNLREASFALGGTTWETITRITVPAAKSGIIGSILLGFGRAIGETMVVLMVAGGAAVIPHTLFQPVRPMTSTIAAEMGESAVGSLHFQSLFGIAIILFIITFFSNLLTEMIFLKRSGK